MTAFIDSNILVYHLAGNHADHSPRSTALLDRLSRGDERAWCTSTVIMETAFVLERVIRVPRAHIAPALVDIVSLPTVEYDHRQSLLRAIDLWQRHGPLSLPDAFHLIFAKDAGLKHIYTFDKKMNRYPGVDRIEP